MTVIKSAPCLDASTLPDVSHMLDALDQDYDLSPNKGVVDLEIRRVVTTSQVTDRSCVILPVSTFQVLKEKNSVVILLGMCAGIFIVSLSIKMMRIPAEPDPCLFSYR